MGQGGKRGVAGHTFFIVRISREMWGHVDIDYTASARPLLKVLWNVGGFCPMKCNYICVGQVVACWLVWMFDIGSHLGSSK